MDLSKFTSGAVVARADFTDDLWMIRVRPEIPISFRAGQYVTLGVEQDGKLLERPYSIVSSPAEPELELFIELVPPGLLTPHLHPLGVGAELVLRPKCKGLFLRECPVEAEIHFFVATVTGIAPYVSWLRQRRAQELAGAITPSERVILLHGASLDTEFGYLEEMRALDAATSWFTYVPTVSRPWLCRDWDGETGRVEDVLRKYADNLGVEHGRAGVYLCGHPGMIATARAIMVRKGLDDKAIREEQYWPEGK